MTSPTVEEFLPGSAPTADLAAWSEVYGDGRREQGGASPSAAVLAERLASREEPGVLRWAARPAPGAPIAGAAELRPRPAADPRPRLLRLFVAPSRRRRGLGRALLRRVMRDAAAAGLDRLQAVVLAGPPGEPFALSVPGARTLLRLDLQEQPVTDPSVLRLCRDLAERPPMGYRLAFWRGSAPEDTAASFARVMNHVLDAPGAELQLAPRSWDVPALRAWEADLTEDGSALLVSTAVHRASGEVVAATAATVPPFGPTAEQHDTAVLPEHRRRNLARWIKAEQTLRLHTLFPHIRTAASTVTADNRAMASVNRAVGYRPGTDRLLVEALLTPEG
ncbi:GNAT family N-acetyltransferase [Nocardiopsis potens]|uniref:GNAT family N-acetyltransferase n=1 Tax=Nocardiopsis potens TaxID=1246458 RepID=UPI0003729928|nr:GNAT family N-acetyltransferase [Nocardiopsis potens]